MERCGRFEPGLDAKTRPNLEVEYLGERSDHYAQRVYSWEMFFAEFRSQFMEDTWGSDSQIRNGVSKSELEKSKGSYYSCKQHAIIEE